MLGLRKPSPAMVVACISLFVGLSGVGTAAVVVLKKNSVLSKHIRNGQVKTVDLGANAVNSAKVGDGSLLAQDFAAGQLPAGPQGPPGPTAAAVSVTGMPPAIGAFSQVRETATITTTVPGKLLVVGDLGPTSTDPGVRVECMVATACTAFFGVYVDGTPVPGSAQLVSGGAGATVDVSAMTLFGILPNVAAGAHTIELRAHKSPVTVSDIDLGIEQLVAIAIG